MNKLRVVIVEFEGDMSGDQLQSTLRDLLGKTSQGVARAIVRDTPPPTPTPETKPEKLAVTPPESPPETPPAPKFELHTDTAHKKRSISDQVLDLIRTEPGIHPVAIAKDVYGDASKDSIRKVHCQFAYLKGLHKIRKIGFGQYEAVQDG